MTLVVDYAGRVSDFKTIAGRVHEKKHWWAGLYSERMAIMGPISRALDRFIDKLPRWAKVILMVLVVVGCVYYIAHYGFLTFLLKAILSPMP